MKFHLLSHSFQPKLTSDTGLKALNCDNKLDCSQIIESTVEMRSRFVPIVRSSLRFADTRSFQNLLIEKWYVNEVVLF